MSERTRIVCRFNPDDICRLKTETDTNITIDGPNLAAHAVRAGLVDDIQFYIQPIMVGGGNRFSPYYVRFNLELLDEGRFDSGVVYLRYTVETN